MLYRFSKFACLSTMGLRERTRNPVGRFLLTIIFEVSYYPYEFLYQIQRRRARKGLSRLARRVRRETAERSHG